MSWWARLWRFRDPALAGLIAAGLTGELLASEDTDATRAVALALGVGAATYFRRTQPVPAFLATWLGLFGIAYLVRSFDNTSTTFVVAYFVAIFSSARTPAAGAVGVGVLVVIAIVTFGVLDGEEFSPGNLAFATFFVGGPWAAGLALRLRGDLADRNRVLEEEQAEATRRAVAAERATIARELHDVVAHAISVTVLQARGARRLLGTDEAAVRRALDAIEHTTTQALGDMRRLLAILRDTEADAATSPQPSLARLDALVEDVRRSGLRVEVHATGEATGVPPGVDLSAYRIVQEALTNTLKHASASSAEVVLVYDDSHLSVAVRDDGVATPDQGGGHGLVGIRERVAVVGGEVTAGPRPGGGFEVSARLPYSVDA